MGNKKKKLPKLPKRKASMSVWKRYEDRLKETERYNANLEKEKKDKERIIKKVEDIKRRMK